MAKLPSPEEAAQEILRIFVLKFKIRAGGGLMAQNLIHLWQQRGMLIEDLNQGLDYAVRKGWIESSQDWDSFKLTEAGYSAA
jgi:hypothetical protein